MGQRAVSTLRSSSDWRWAALPSASQAPTTPVSSALRAARFLRQLGELQQALLQDGGAGLLFHQEGAALLRLRQAAFLLGRVPIEFGQARAQLVEAVQRGLQLRLAGDKRGQARELRLRLDDVRQQARVVRQLDIAQGDLFVRRGQLLLQGALAAPALLEQLLLILRDLVGVETRLVELHQARRFLGCRQCLLRLFDLVAGQGELTLRGLRLAAEAVDEGAFRLQRSQPRFAELEALVDLA